MQGVLVLHKKGLTKEILVNLAKKELKMSSWKMDTNV